MKTKHLLLIVFLCLAHLVSLAQPFGQLVTKFKLISNPSGNVCSNNTYLFAGNYHNNVTDTIFIYSIITGDLVGFQKITANGSSGGFGIKATYNRMYVGSDMYTLKSYDISNILNWVPVQTISGLDQGFLRGMMSNDSTTIAWGGHWAGTYQFFDISSGVIVQGCKVNTNGNNYNADRYMNNVYVENAYSGDARIDINNISSCSVTAFGGSCGGCPHTTLSGYIVYGPRTSSCNPQRIEIYNQSNILTGSLTGSAYSPALCLPHNYVLVSNTTLNKQVLYSIYDGTFNHPIDTIFNNTLGGYQFNKNYIFRFINDTCEIYTRFTPGIQASNVTFSNILTNQLSSNWTDGNGSKRAVFIKQDNLGTPIPAYNTTYTANTIFGSGSQIGSSGWYCVYNGTTHASGITVTNLLPNTNYRVMVCEYNGSAGSEQYNTSSVNNNPLNTITQSGSCPSSFVDSRDGKTYHGVQIGTQCWMKENLNVGTRINGSQNQTNNGIIEKYCYNDLETNCAIYGGLYQWNEAMQYATSEGIQGICPTGWHLPTHIEWTALSNFLGGEYVAGGKMTDWCIVGCTNSSGFTGLHGGIREVGPWGIFRNLGDSTYFLSSSQFQDTDAWSMCLGFSTPYAMILGINKASGISARCVKDNIISSPTSQGTNINFFNVSTDQFTFNWTDGSGSSRAVFIKKDSVGTAAPVNNSTYSSNTVFGSGTQIGTSGWYCVFNGITHVGGVVITNLLPNTKYRVMVCEYNDISGSEQYNSLSANNNPNNQKTCGGNILTNGLLAWYPFNGNANDGSGNGNNGTVYGALLVPDRFGNPNSAYSFNSPSDWISINNTTLANFGISNFTIAGWVNLSVYTSGTSAIFSKRNTGVYGNFVEFDINNWKIKGEIDQSSISDYSVVASTSSVIINNWYFGTFVREANSIKMYFNGNLEETVTTPIIQNINNTAHASIGQLDGGGYANLTGKIDDIRIYNRALSQCEITALFNETASFVVTASPNPINGGNTTGGGTYQNGTQITVSATPNTGWNFINWTENENSVASDQSYNFTVSSNRTLIANFALQQFSISTSSNPVAGGATTGDGTYNYGTQVTATATPNTGWNFTNWTENGISVSTNLSYAFTANSNRNLVANFALQQFSISTSSNPVAGGATTGDGTYNYGTQVTATATPNTGWNFTNWTENGISVSTNLSYAFTANSSRNLVANFVLQQFSISTSSNPVAGGATTGDGTYNYGTQVTATATLNTGWNFTNWTENGISVSTNLSYAFTANSSRNLVANFVLQQFSISTSSNPVAGGATTGDGTYNYGTQVTATATPNTGWNFTNWTENGISVSTNLSYAFTANSNRNLVANFALQQFSISTSSNPVAGGATTGDGTYNYGTQVTATATPNTGWNFTNWTENGISVSANLSYAFTANSNRNLVANFALQQFSISTSSNPIAGGVTTGDGTYNYGTQVTAIATPNTGWNFTNWTENGISVSTNLSYAFTANSSRNLVANFVLQQFSISTSSNPVTGGVTTGDGTYNYGTQVSVTATPNTGWNFTNWTENGSVVSTNSSYTYSVSGNRILIANFSQLNVLIVANANPTNGGFTTGGGYYGIGSLVSVKATPNSDYSFLNWTEYGSQVSIDTFYTFIATSNRNLVANFFYGVNIDELNSQVKIFPNPTTGIIKIQSEITIKDFEIYNSIGIKVINRVINTSELILDLSQYSKGVYFIRLTIGDAVRIHKLILL